MRRAQPRAARREDAERNADGDRRRASRRRRAHVLGRAAPPTRRGATPRTRSSRVIADPSATRGAPAPRRAGRARAGRRTPQSRAAGRTRSAGRHRARRCGRPARTPRAMSCVTIRTVLRRRPGCGGTRACSSARVIGSSAPNGSSIRRIGGSTASARATPTRCRWPPDSSSGQRAREPSRSRPISSSSSSTRVADALGRPAFEPRHNADVAGDGHVREQPDLLQHVADAAPQPDRFPLARVAAFDDAPRRRRAQQPVDELEERGLAGAAPADQRDDLARLDDEIEAVEHALAARAHEGHVPELDGRHA